MISKDLALPVIVTPQEKHLLELARKADPEAVDILKREMLILKALDDCFPANKEAEALNLELEDRISREGKKLPREEILGYLERLENMLGMR